MKIYIAGKITGDPNYIEHFGKVEQLLKEKGHVVINPIEPEGFEYREYIDMGLSKLMKCDAICLLDNCHMSPGAMLEYDYAVTCNLKIFYETHMEDIPDAENNI